MQRGGGIVGIHADANADRNWAWKGDMMGGALVPQPPGRRPPVPEATVNDRRPDAPRDGGDRRPTWVRDGRVVQLHRGAARQRPRPRQARREHLRRAGRHRRRPTTTRSRGARTTTAAAHFYTALGHNGTAWQEPRYRAHILGAIQWAAGEAEGDCGEEREGLPTDASFDKVTLDDNTENPMEIAVAPDGNVYYVELAGKVKDYNRARPASVRTDRHDPGAPRQRERPARHRARPGLRHQPLALPLLQRADARGAARLALHARRPTARIDMASEKRPAEIPHQRIICCHSAGSMTFGPDGRPATSPPATTPQHARVAGLQPDRRRRLAQRTRAPTRTPTTRYDARRTSGNTNDLRGKILRIRPLATRATRRA